jgi:PHD/YefM family antitoxin component YafN of YafNO toxin-antitoxin module
MAMKSVVISTFKAQYFALLEEVARTGAPLLVTKRGNPFVRHAVEALGDVIAPAIPRSA